jgi:GNAT superfamily N-acetyltransferase
VRVPTVKQLLDNITWHTLTSLHAKFSSGTGAVRRYAPGFSPILGFADPQRPEFACLLPFCQPGEHFYCDGWSGAIPDGWQMELESTMFKMIWDSSKAMANDCVDAVKLGPEHAQQALELAELTRPGPFGPRTIELGDYYGFFVGNRLVGMAGERMFAGSLREISGVCTHPDFQGRGFARRLMSRLISQQLQRSEIPFLHVMRDNTSARQLYERLGFTVYRESVVRVVSRAA